MKIPDSRSVPLAVLHERRIVALGLHRRGMSFTEIGKLVSANRNTVAGWCKAFAKKNHPDALKPKPTGRPQGSGRQLNAHQETILKRAIVDRRPEQLRMDFALWTRAAVRDLIHLLFKVRLPIRTVGDYLKRWGFTPQRPLKRAYQRDEKKVQSWLKVEYPKISQLAQEQSAEIHWCDETGISTDDASGRGYAPKGETPVRLADGRQHQRINVISSITNQGKVRFMLYEESLNAERMIEFMKRLIRDAKKPVFLILDNLRVHHAKHVKEWVAGREAQIQLFYLPSYSPDLNPDEYLNCDLKRSLGEKAGTRDKQKIKARARGHLRMLQNNPQRVVSYFKAKSIQYAAA